MNVALNKQSVQSSSQYGGASSRALDGNIHPAFDAGILFILFFEMDFQYLIMPTVLFDNEARIFKHNHIAHFKKMVENIHILSELFKAGKHRNLKVDSHHDLRKSPIG